MCPRVERFHVNHIHKLFMTALNEEIIITNNLDYILIKKKNKKKL